MNCLPHAHGRIATVLFQIAHDGQTTWFKRFGRITGVRVRDGWHGRQTVGGMYTGRWKEGVRSVSQSVGLCTTQTNECNLTMPWALHWRLHQTVWPVGFCYCMCCPDQLIWCVMPVGRLHCSQTVTARGNRCLYVMSSFVVMPTTEWRHFEKSNIPLKSPASRMVGRVE